MIIQEVEINNILGCGPVKLCFNDTNRSPVYVVQGEDDTKAHNILTLAVQLICSAKYAHITSLADPELKGIQCGSVRLKFILPLSPGRDILEAFDIQFNSSEDPQYIEGAIDEQEGACGGGGLVGQIEEQESEIYESAFGHFGNDREQLSSTMVTDGGHDFQSHRLSSKSNVRKLILVNAYRDFSKNPDEVYYSINDGEEEKCSLPAFHGRFYICMDYILPQLENLKAEFSGDWLELLVADVNEKWNRRKQLYDPFIRFVRLFQKYGYPEQHLLPQLTRSSLMNKETMDTIQKTYAIKILRDCRGIFEFITAGEFTVWFYIPHCGQYADAIAEVMVEDLNFEYMVTFIQNTSQTIRRMWTEAPKAIRDLLLISFQLSLAFHCKQQIIYLQNFREICQYQAIQLASFAYWQKLKIGKTTWTCKNYLQRVIDVCITIGTTAIIEYPGGIPLHPVNAYMIKIYQNRVAENRTMLDMKIVNGEQYSFDYFLDCLKDGLKRRSNLRTNQLDNQTGGGIYS